MLWALDELEKVREARLRGLAFKAARVMERAKVILKRCFWIGGII